MLQGFTLSATPDHLAQGRELRLCQHALEFEVKVDAFLPENVREQVLGIQARTVYSVSFEIVRRRLKHF
jgi:hypothetical protein